MLIIDGHKVKDVPLIKAKIIEIWVNGYKVWPEPEPLPKLPEELIKRVRSCFALGEWYNYFVWTNELSWSNNIQEALNYFNELYGTHYELLLDEEQ